MEVYGKHLQVLALLPNSMVLRLHETRILNALNDQRGHRTRLAVCVDARFIPTKCYLLCVMCWSFPNVSIANGVKADQTAPGRAVCSGSTLFQCM